MSEPLPEARAFAPGWADRFGRELARGDRTARLSFKRESRVTPETLERMRASQRARWAKARGESSNETREPEAA